MNVKTGTIGRFTLSPNRWQTQNIDVSGVIVATPKETPTEYRLVTLLGETVKFNEDRLLSIKSIRVAPEVRYALTEISKKYKQILLFEKEKGELVKKINTLASETKVAQRELTHLSGFYTMSEVENKFAEINFRISGSTTGGDTIWLDITQSSDGERYSKPDVSKRFPFVYQEYDGVCFLQEELAPKAYKDYVAKNAPNIKPALKKLADEVEQSVDVGDKYIYATTTYKLKFKDGLKIQDVDKVIKTIAN
jgi:hypothetical protein